MKKIILFSIILLTGCLRRESQELVSNNYFNYQNLGDFDWDYNHPLQLDINNDNVTDFDFTSIVSSNGLDNSVEKIEFYVSSNKGSLILLGNTSPMVFNTKDNIHPFDTLGCNWSTILHAA